MADIAPERELVIRDNFSCRGYISLAYWEKAASPLQKTRAKPAELC